MIIGTTKIQKVFRECGYIKYVSFTDLEDPGYEYREYIIGTKEWYRDGELHCEDGPAVIHSDGYEGWYQYGTLHRDNDLPAVINPYRGKEWWINGKRHRHNDLPAVIELDGTQKWYYNGIKHRGNDLPAVIAPGRQEWWVDGKRQRIGGPPNIFVDEDYEDGEYFSIDEITANS